MHMLPKISLKQLYYFVAVADNGKINSAAESIPISASVLTDAIKKMEQQLDIQLFERTREGMRLTYDGFRLLEQARTILRLTDEVSENVGKFKAEIAGSLELTVTPAIMGYFLPDIFARFKRIYPSIKINVYECERPELENRLKNNLTDLGLMIVSNLSAKKGMHVETLINSRRKLWCSSNHPFANKNEIDIKSLNDEIFIMPYLDEAHVNLLTYLEKQDVHPKEIISTQTTEAVRSLVANSVGVTILSDLLYRPWSLEGVKLVRKTIKQSAPSMNLGVVWPKNVRLNSIGNVFADFLRRECSHINENPQLHGHIS